MLANKAVALDMTSLGEELARLGCGYNKCGRFGFIFAPQRSGGLQIEDGFLHYWDTGVNVYLNLASASQRLAGLPNNVGHETLRDSLLEIEPE